MISSEVVLGIIIGEMIDATKKWYGNNKGNKDKAKELLLQLKVLIEKPVLHMDLSTQTVFSLPKYLPYLTEDIEKLHSFISLNEYKFDEDVRKSIRKYLTFLVESKILFTRASLGNMEDVRCKEIKKYASTIGGHINNLVSQG